MSNPTYCWRRCGIPFAAALITFALGGCKTPGSAARLKDDTSTVAVSGDCSRRGIVDVLAVAQMEAPASGHEAAGLTDDATSADPANAATTAAKSGDAPAPSGSGEATIDLKLTTPAADCPPIDTVAMQRDAGNSGSRDGLALEGAVSTVSEWVAPVFVKGVESMYGTELWDRVKDIPFDAPNICQGTRRPVNCGPFNIRDDDGKCYETALQSYAKSPECRYACARCINPLEMLSNFHGYLSKIDSTITGIDWAQKHSPKAASLVATTLDVTKKLAAALCSYSLSDKNAAISAADCLKSKLFQADTWKKAREKLGTVVAIGDCASEALGTVKIAGDYLMQMAGKADYGYLGDGPVEGMLNLGCSALAIVNKCSEVPGLKAAFAPVQQAIDKNPYLAGLTATCIISKAVATEAVCNAAKNSCLLQVHSYARPIEIAQPALKATGEKTSVKNCCLCDYENRNWLGVTSGQAECEKGLALPQGSKRKNCRFVTVESETCSLSRQVNAYDDANRITGTGFEPKTLNNVATDGGNPARITNLNGTIAPPSPPIFFFEYGVQHVDPATGAVEWGEPKQYSYQYMVFFDKRNWSEAYNACSGNGYRLPTAGELGYLRSDVNTKFPRVEDASTISLDGKSSKPNDPWYYYYTMGGELRLMQPGFKTNTVCVRRM